MSLRIKFGGQNTTRLGFGTAQLARFQRPVEMRRLLEEAFEAGIRHFDTARAYGHGCMEGFCAPFFKRHRDEITVATKAGLGFDDVSSTFEWTYPLRKIAGKFRPYVRPVRPIKADLLQRSVEQSLRELKMERLDFFLLHEHTFSEYLSLVPILEKLVQQGKIGLSGIASYYPDLLGNRETDVSKTSAIIQSNLGTKDRPLNVSWDPVPRITHSVFTGAQGDHFNALKTAFEANPHGIVLIGTCQAKHLRQSVDAVLNFKISA